MSYTPADKPVTPLTLLRNADISKPFKKDGLLDNVRITLLEKLEGDFSDRKSLEIFLIEKFATMDSGKVVNETKWL